MKKTAIGFLVLFVFVGLTVTGHSRRAAAGSLPPGQQGISRTRAINPDGSSPAAPAVVSTVHSNPDFGQVPLYFIANAGQADRNVDYYVQGADKTISFGPGGVTFSLNKPRKERSPAARRPGPEAPGTVNREGAGTWGVRLDFIGANAEVRPKGGDKTDGVVSYFEGKPEDWKTGIPTYSRLVYSNLWPGIDLAYSGTVNQLKYEFVVAPGADPGLIRLAYRGASEFKIGESGRLELGTPYGGFEDGAPIAYQEIDGRRIPVSIAYAPGEPDPKNSSFPYGFQVGEYDRTRPLILDPVVLVYCGYVGGYSDEEAYDLAVDSTGNVYIAGYTWSDPDTFPVIVGPDLTRAVNYDGFVAKLNASGTALIYCGYIGGDGFDECQGVAVDASGSAYITGFTTSSQATFPVLTGPDVTHNGFDDVFVTKVNPSGTALVYSGYIGGSDQEWARDIAVDGSGNAYVTGTVLSTQATFPETVGPDLTHNGGNDAFVAKVNAAGSGLAYCGYIGGSSSDIGYGIAVSSTGNAYVTGYTQSAETTFPEAVGPDLNHNGGVDAFAAKVNAAGNALVYCGYIGGSGTDYGYDIALDSSEKAYVVGETYSSEATFPLLVGPDLTHNGGYDGFIAKVGVAGTALVYSGYVGGTDWDGIYSVAVDGAGNAYVTGYAYSDETTFPASGGPDLTHNGDADAFIAKVNASGDGLAYCGYLGGPDEDQGYGVAVDTAGSAYVTGYANSLEPDFPVYIGPDLTHNGSEDVFVAKIVEEPLWKPHHAVGDFDGDGVDEAAVDFGGPGAWMYDSGAWSQLTAANPESLLAADVDGDIPDEIIADLGFSGLWLWNGGAWNQLSAVNVESFAAGDTDAEGIDEVVGDFGPSGLWLFDGGNWTQLSGVNADYVATANLDAAGGDEIIGDFGSTGLWFWNAGSWTQLSGVNADYMMFGDTNGLPGAELAGDFGPTGLWLYGGGLWTQLSGVNADYAIAVDVDGSGDDEIFGDFAATGMWLWDSGSWTQLSNINPDFMIGADTDGDGAGEVVGDFGTLGMWLVDGGSWTQISGVNPDYMYAADVDGDNAAEILGDFGSLGIYLWDAGAWSQISALDPE
ncbi:MAG: hypothetical protein A2W03_01560 [Candidatus Aminicenantes bacterium RBG_16_63_16]|nr:MAG: hypothetical protein A2W03_01560 [Candidatus Aminicenantes bacterium RBG_16_63_16]